MKRFSLEERLFYALLVTLMLLLHGSLLVLKMEVLGQKRESLKRRSLVITIDRRISQQIVRSEDSDQREIRDEAFLSDKTRSFDRQMKAANQGTFSQGNRSEKMSKRDLKNLKFSDLAAASSADPFSNPSKDDDQKKNHEAKTNHHRTLSSTNDFIQEIPLGDVTNLNTVEYKYFGFYQRIRQRLEQFWGRSLAAKAQQLAKDGEKILSSNDYITALLISLDEGGEVIAIKVKATSGIKELDDAAIESFNQAGPFPNPPKDLFVDGIVTLEWGFVVES
jgi:TonB family protein